jgi:hypothetical protein
LRLFPGNRKNIAKNTICFKDKKKHHSRWIILHSIVNGKNSQNITEALALLDKLFAHISCAVVDGGRSVQLSFTIPFV